MLNVKFAKVKLEATIPSKRLEDGAFDIYACFEEDSMTFEPHETKMVPTGIASAFSTDYVAVLKERGSTGSKGMGLRCGVIDSGYRGEWFVAMTNHNNIPFVIAKEKVANDFTERISDYIIYPYEKAIAQCLMIEVPKMVIEEISYEDLLKIESERGIGALGSSGK